MFDVRYHAMSLVAVFVALVVGLTLGVAIGDHGLVSRARDNLREDLQGEVTAAHREVASARQELATAHRFEDLVFPALVRQRLEGRRIAVLFLNGRADGIFDRVRAALDPAGAQITSVFVLQNKLDFDALGRASNSERFQDLGNDPTLINALGRHIGTELVDGGKLIKQLRSSLFRSSSGVLTGADGVIVVRSAGVNDVSPEGKDNDNFARGLMRGLRTNHTPVVGVEQATAASSQVGWYHENHLASVDNIDQSAGQTSLVFVLSGAANGAYGVKSTRDALVPEAVATTQ